MPVAKKSSLLSVTKHSSVTCPSQCHIVSTGKERNTKNVNPKVDTKRKRGADTEWLSAPCSETPGNNLIGPIVIELVAQHTILRWFCFSSFCIKWQVPNILLTIELKENVTFSSFDRQQNIFFSSSKVHSLSIGDQLIANYRKLSFDWLFCSNLFFFVWVDFFLV